MEARGVASGHRVSLGGRRRLAPRLGIVLLLLGLALFSWWVLPNVSHEPIGETAASFAQIRTALVAYSTDYASYPPGYGYRVWGNDAVAGYRRENGTSPSPGEMYSLVPYLHRIRLFRVFGIYDEEWAKSYDTNGNHHIDHLEFNPLGMEEAPGQYRFRIDTLYDGANLPDETSRMMVEPPPFTYIPVNKAQALRFRQFCEAGLGDQDKLYARRWDDTSTFLSDLVFPPDVYDAFTLVSPGPGGSTGGVVPSDKDLIVVPGREMDTYYITALRAYYLATRDLNHNGKPDFEFRARTRQGETEYLLPDGTNGPGPVIYVSE